MGMIEGLGEGRGEEEEEVRGDGGGCLNSDSNQLKGEC